MDPRLLLFAVALVLVAAACGGANPGHSAGSTHVSQALAFARCMRAHGVPRFPDPDPQGNFPSFSTGVSKQTSSAANDTCQHLISSGGSATPQQLQQKLEFGVKVAECLRAHGYPNFPDPKQLGQQPSPPGIDTNAPHFQAVETTCEVHARKALGLP